MQKISRSKIDLFLNCPRCFYLDVAKGIKRPPGFPFSLNNAVDALLKKEFDLHRAAGTPHPIQTKFGVDAIPSNHPIIDKCRQSMQHGGQGTTGNRTGRMDHWIQTPNGSLPMVVAQKRLAGIKHSLLCLLHRRPYTRGI